jgi:hypothetical protein
MAAGDVIDAVKTSSTTGTCKSSRGGDKVNQHKAGHYNRHLPPEMKLPGSEMATATGVRSRNHQHHHHHHHGVSSYLTAVSSGAVYDVSGVAASPVKRSKSDVQDIINVVVGDGDENNSSGGDETARSRRQKLTSSLVKRSRSFHKLFTTSMLSRTKEYNFQ